MSRTVAVTGATGFVGRHVVAALAAEGWQLRILLRSEPVHALWQDLKPDIVLGSLQDRPALATLLRGCDAVLHLAGAIKARDAETFMDINRDGTRAVAEIAREVAPAAHFLHVSSLAAREPQLSGYCASKRAGEDVAMAVLGPGRLSIIRPPAIYGPGDRETLVFFQLARHRLVPLLGAVTARLAVIHVEDAARALVARLGAGPSGRVQALADERPGGYTWREILGTAADAVGNRSPRFFTPPRPLLSGAGRAAGVAAKLLGQAAMFNQGKLKELLHEDWSVSAAELMPKLRPSHSLSQGFETTARWYCKSGWLPPI